MVSFLAAILSTSVTYLALRGFHFFHLSRNFKFSRHQRRLMYRMKILILVALLPSLLPVTMNSLVTIVLGHRVTGARLGAMIWQTQTSSLFCINLSSFAF